MKFLKKKKRKRAAKIFQDSGSSEMKYEITDAILLLGHPLWTEDVTSATGTESSHAYEEK